ncbi:hypothetical protein AGMMS50230_05280 [Spirochaetia bacterium]|nr:hypothetical protein AGMMS50230_05280 [Spirochaetia bacterium]
MSKSAVPEGYLRSFEPRQGIPSLTKQQAVFVRVRLLDLVIFCLTAAVTLFCALLVYGKNTSSLKLVIQGKSGNWVYPMEAAVLVDIAGPLGNTTVELKDRQVRVVASPCTNQTCISSGGIHNRGQWLACLPNGVFVSVEPVNAEANKPGDNLDAAVW